MTSAHLPGSAHVTDTAADQAAADQAAADQASADQAAADAVPHALLQIGHIARDVVREALARRTIAMMIGLLGVAQVALALALDIDVVEGAIVSSRLFGEALGISRNNADAADQMRPLLQTLTHVVFHVGMLFGIVATSDLAARALAPGRVELLLALPVRRVEFVLGTYLGVAVVAAVGTVFAIGGFSAVLLWKVEIATAAPLYGAAAAALGFAAIYAAMLLVTTVARSPALAAGVGMVLYIVSSVTSRREAMLSWFEAGWPRDVAAIVCAPLPRLLGVSELGANLASGGAVDWTEAGIAVATTGLFAAGALAAAAWVVEGRDW